ncbi:RimK/LysX family protein [Lutibacter sp. A64]|uniref:ATP-dependent zinc protease family protein n=1 Tax=Lutibacter sp. A64 TaxID=2918526 RepID=UPI001F05976A|nr:RimK/LysX family protein [Lutibacter sp. A64]UMB53090.1 RimK/LysX family protein [Lutibacter sp. A64]
MKTPNTKTLIGRTDIVDFPKLELFGIAIKVDSGAYTSSFHCHHIEVENEVLKCQFLDPEHEKYHQKYFYFKEFIQKNVKSSNGIIESRFIITTEILIFNKIHNIELSLTERGSMMYPVLLGRKFLSKKFIIDTAKKNLSLKKINS